MAAVLLAPIAAEGMSKGIDAGINLIANAGGGKKRAADMTFGTLYTDASMALGILSTVREASPEDSMLALLEMQLTKMQATAKSGMAIFDKADDPVPK